MVLPSVETRNAVFILKNKQGKVLLEHKHERDILSPSQWGLFRGTIRGGENPKKVAIRHAKHSLGIVLKDPEFFRRYELPDRKGRYHEYFVFLAPMSKPVSELKKYHKSGDNLSLFSFEDTKTITISEHVTLILKDIFGLREKAGLLEVEKKRGS